MTSVAFDRNPAGRNHICRYAKWGNFRRQAAVKTVLPAFGGHVGGKVRDASLDDFRTDIDDPPPALFFHVRQTSPSEKEGAFDEEIDHRLEEIPIIVFDP